MNKDKYVILDVDGSLVDSMSVYTKTFSGILSRRFRIPIEESSKYFLISAGTPLDIQFRYVLEKNNKSTGEIQSMR